jgi:hypothetical protein
MDKQLTAADALADACLDESADKDGHYVECRVCGGWGRDDLDMPFYHEHSCALAAYRRTRGTG